MNYPQRMTVMQRGYDLINRREPVERDGQSINQSISQSVSRLFRDGISGDGQMVIRH